MFFNKKTITSSQFNRDFFWPVLDIVNEDCTNEILNVIKQDNIEVDKTEEEVEIEVGIWVNHIVGKLLNQTKIIKHPSSPEAINFSQDMFNYFLERWGKDKDSKKFISHVKEIYKKKIPSYQQYEFAYARSEMRIEDFEACVIAILLGIKYQEVTNSLVTVTKELHKGATLLIMNFLKEFTAKYKVIDSEVNRDLLEKAY